MKSESLSNLKKEILDLPPEMIIQFCLRLAKYKTENKELLNYLIYQAYDQHSFIEQVKEEINNQFKTLNKSQIYLAKKTIRKVLKTTRKYIRFSGNKQTELELLIHFCYKMKQTGLATRNGKVLENIYLNQLTRIKVVYKSLHEDMQMDFSNELEKLL